MSSIGWYESFHAKAALGKLTFLCSAWYVSALVWCIPPVPANCGSQCLNTQISNLRNSAN